MRRALAIVVAGGVLAGSAGCRQDMHDQPKYKVQGRSEFFTDERNGRPRVEGTVARGHLKTDAHLHSGKTPTGFATELPMPLDYELLHRGRERFDIYCSPCHGRTGQGNGMVVQRGYRQPSSFHVERLRAQPVGYFFDVMTNGFGVMPSYSTQVPVRDRWAIAAYVKTLQLSQFARPDQVPPGERAALGANP